ncbi:MAG: hypothetical protein HY203_10080 [Nitrospirae bacterium]|nr:hypothetical protein [Nitrospirota bacterium]
MIITEPDVALTDYGLAVELAFFAYLLHNRGNRQQPLRTWFVLFFGSLGLAALTGGSVHGFFSESDGEGHVILWRATLLAMGMATLAAWAIGARIQFSETVARWVLIAALAQFIGYCVNVLFVTQVFRIAIADYLPAAVFLLFVFFLAYKRTRDRQPLVGSMGLTLTFVASWVQQHGIALHPVYFDHNAFYHLIQAAALFMIFWAARGFVTEEVTQ